MEKFSLKWQDYEQNIGNALNSLREEKEFFDVTLACEDNQIEAHKVILSACSPFFKNILKRNPHQHPLLYLKGVRYSEMVSLLNFMYLGHVNIAQDDLNKFLAVAEELQIKGLTQSKATSPIVPSSSQSPIKTDRNTPGNIQERYKNNRDNANGNVLNNGHRQLSIVDNDVKNMNNGSCKTPVTNTDEDDDDITIDVVDDDEEQDINLLSSKSHNGKRNKNRIKY